jgi:CheY-like chemotaxis protein
MVKAIVELHGGDVRAESAGIGKGVEFVVRIPLGDPSNRVATTTTASTALSGGRRVLVVDDNKDAAESLAGLLRMLGHGADVAFNGPSALAMLETRQVDVVFCDIGMPGMNGYDLARHVRAGGGSIKLVALSGYAQQENVNRALEAGFDAHIAKPPDLELIARLLGAEIDASGPPTSR